MSAYDKNAYEILTQLEIEEEGQLKPIEHASAFLIHLLFKAIPLGLFLFRGMFAPMLTDLLVVQLIFIFIVVDFWMTKNINGRKMIGIRWFFDDDQFGVQRFKVECRANDEFVSAVNGKLFWLVQMAYLVLPIIFLITTFIIAPNLQRIQMTDMLINTSILVGGGSNLFFFFKASSISSERQIELKKKIGTDFLRKLGPSTIISYM